MDRTSRPLRSLYRSLFLRRDVLLPTPPKEMRDALIRACGLGDKLAEIDRKRAVVYANRTDANRERERLQDALATLLKPAAGVPPRGSFG